MFRNPYTDGLVIILILLLIFGPKRLPGLGRSLGHGLREFRDSITGDSKSSESDGHPELTQSSTGAPPDVASAGSTAEREAAETQPSERRP